MLGAVLVLAGISQIVNLSAARSWTVVPGGFFVIPMFVQYIHLATGERETVILNKHGEQAHAASKVPN